MSHVPRWITNLGYVPLFDSLVKGTLHGRWPDVGLWPIVLSMADKYGNVDVTPQYISSATGLAVDEVIACMARFCAPDRASRSKSSDGRRLLLIDPDREWGWHVVNHGLYREKARLLARDSARTASGEDAERKRRERGSPPKSPESPLSNADANSDSDKSKNKNGGAGAPLVLHESLPRETWEEWIKHRRERRMPMTHRALQRQLAELSKHDTVTQRAMIDQAINAGWQGIFPPKSQARSSSASDRQTWKPDATK